MWKQWKTYCLGQSRRWWPILNESTLFFPQFHFPFIDIVHTRGTTSATTVLRAWWLWAWGQTWIAWHFRFIWPISSSNSNSSSHIIYFSTLCTRKALKKKRQYILLARCMPDPSPIGLSILRDIESNKCCTKIAGLDYFLKSRNCNLRLLLHKVFLKLHCENEIKQTPPSRYIYWKMAAEVCPFERRHYSPSRPLATDREQLVQGDSEFTNLVSRPKVIPVAPV